MMWRAWKQSTVRVYCLYRLSVAVMLIETGIMIMQNVRAKRNVQERYDNTIKTSGETMTRLIIVLRLPTQRQP